MAYMDAYKSFFRSPKWGMNLLLLSVCSLIPIAGPIASQGYFITTIVQQHLYGDDHPRDFNFDNFVELLGRGVWPFLVSLILALVLIPLYAIAAVPLVLGLNVQHERFMVPGIILTVALVLVSAVFFFMTSLPLMLRASFMQQVSGVFSWAFVKDYVGKMWAEIIISQLFLMGTSLVLVLLGYLTCGIGLYPAIALMYHAVFQLYLQLYEIYLGRGGQSVPIKPELAKAAELAR
jgi:hypothetical protein